MNEKEILTMLVELERRVTVLEAAKREENEYDPFALPSEDARRRAVLREEVEKLGNHIPCMSECNG